MHGHRVDGEQSSLARGSRADGCALPDARRSSGVRCYNLRSRRESARRLRAEADRLADESLRPQGAHRARREEDRVPGWSRRRRATPGNPVHAVQPARQGPRARARRRHALFDSRVIVEYLDTVSPVSRLIPEPSAAAHRRAALGSARRRHLRRGGGDRRWSAGGRRSSRASEWIERQRAARSTRASPSWRASSAIEPWCNGEAYSLADIADRLRARLPRPAPSGPRLARRVPEPRAARRKLGKRPSFQDTAVAA